jgi:cytochrome c biogenesis protein CcmG, thiol:disulfide interchange protein DsbE
MQVEFYSRKGSTPCAEARAILEKVRRDIPFELIEVDIEQDPKLLKQFEQDVPVIYVDGRKAFKRGVDEAVFTRKLERGRAFAMGTLDPRANLTRGRPVTRQTKIVFMIVALAAIVGVFANKGYEKLVVNRDLDVRALEVDTKSYPAPPFALTDQSGRIHNLADYRGKVVFLNFWATWCAPCREEMPDMDRLARILGGEKDFAMVAVSVDDDWRAVSEFFGGKEPPFTVVRDDGAKVSQAYGTTMYPESYVIDRDGKVIAKFVGIRGWADPAAVSYLRRLIGERT